jgi:hypothetical protein
MKPGESNLADPGFVFPSRRQPRQMKFAPLHPPVSPEREALQKPISGAGCLSDSEFQAHRFLRAWQRSPKGRDSRETFLLITFLLAEKKSDSPRRVKPVLSDRKAITTGSATSAYATTGTTRTSKLITAYEDYVILDRRGITIYVWTTICGNHGYPDYDLCSDRV